MLKKHLISSVAVLAGESESTIRKIFEATTSVVLTTLASGSSVMLLGIGKLSVVRRGPKSARHMVSGERVVVPARNVAKLRPSEAVHDAINHDPK